MKPLTVHHTVLMGCDPEFFFSTEGKVIGAEKCLPETGLEYVPGSYIGKHDGSYTSGGSKKSQIVIDGVQAEINPRPNTCRANLANEISCCFRKLHDALTTQGKKVNLTFKPLVKISKKELDSLSEKSKIFGCAPSNNIYNQEESKIKVNPKRYLRRSAGGHIHLGNTAIDINANEIYKNIPIVLQNAKLTVPILDSILGNTCVLLDRNPDNVERRRVYGKVGEYRQKDYGLEYRTLSNFWLRSYPLMSFVMGMARFCVHATAQSNTSNDYVTAITKAVSRERIIQAVQENNFDLAYENFSKLEPIILELAGENTDHFPINSLNIKFFHHFVKRGMDYWFKDDSFNHWISLPECHGRGFETFLNTTVRNDINKPEVVIEARKPNTEIKKYNINMVNI